MEVKLLKKLVAEFKQLHLKELQTNLDAHYLTLSIGDARDFLMQRLGGPEMYWKILAEAVMEEFEPNSDEKPCTLVLTTLSTDTGFAASCGSRAAPSMIETRKKLEEWHQGSRLKFSRFWAAQREHIAQATQELKQGRKRSHWIWFIFPQVQGLGQSSIAQHYGFQDRKEIETYISDQLVYPDLVRCTYLVLDHKQLPLEDIFPYPDNLKFISCMTAFALCQDYEPVFNKALEVFNEGKYCLKTIEFLAEDV